MCVSFSSQKSRGKHARFKVTAAPEYYSKRRSQATAFEGVAAIGPRKQLIDVAVWMAVDDPGEGIGQIGKRIDVAQLTGLDQRGDDGPVLGAAVGACEQRILPVERNGAD